MRTLSACMLLLAFGSVATTIVSDHLIVEVWFVIEPEVVRTYEGFGYTAAQAKIQIQGDLKYYVYETNKFYESMSNYGLYMEIRSAGVTFTDSELFSGSDISGGNHLSPDTALKKLKTWLAKNTELSKKYSHDITILFTGYDLYNDGSSATAGYATLEGACQGDATAIGTVEFKGTHSTAITLAHELGHSLGSPHDGAGNTCLVKDGYIMTPVSTANNPNRWSFSICTEQSIAKYMNKIKTSSQIPNCLTKANTKAPASTFNLNEEKNRDILKFKKICERVHNDKTGFMCLNEALYDNVAIQDKMCDFLMCGKASTTSCTATMPTEGMECGVQKRCNKGKCVSAPLDFPTPKNLNPSCLFNDTRSTHLFTNFAGTCAEYVTNRGHGNCYNSVFEHRCCESCGKVYTGTKGCEYGDKAAWCVTEAAQKLLSQVCIKGNIANCCATCKPTTNIAGCLYGDKATWCDPKNKGDSCYSSNKDVCCETCNGYTG